MKELLGDTFKNALEIQCENFIKWYVNSKCGTDSSRDLSKANCHFNKLYPEYEPYCETKGIDKMSIEQFKKHCSKAIKNLGYKTIQKKNLKKNLAMYTFCLAKKYNIKKSNTYYILYFLYYFIYIIVLPYY